MNSIALMLWRSVSVGVPRILKGETTGAAGIQSLITRILVIGLNVATGVLTARFLGAEGRGEQAAMILWQGFLAGMFTFGLPSSLIYNLNRRAEEKSKLLGSAILMGGLCGVLAGLVGVIFLPTWLAQYSPQVVRQAQFLMINAPIASLMMICRAGLESRGDFTSSNKTLLFTPLITLIGLIALIPLESFTPFNSAFIYAFSSFPIFVWTFIVLWKFYRPNLSGFRAMSKTLLNYGLRSYGADLLGKLAAQIDQVLVINFLSPSAMGIYVVALNLSRMLYVIQSSMVIVLFPQIAAQPIDEVIKLTGQAARISVAITAVASVVMILLGPLVLRILYGSEFNEAAPLLNILIVEAGLGGTIWILTTGFLALNKPGTVTILQGLGLGLSLPLLLILIPRYGMYGASIALLASTVVRLIFVQICFPWVLKVRAPSLIINREDIRLLRKTLLSS